MDAIATHGWGCNCEVTWERVVTTSFLNKILQWWRLPCSGGSMVKMRFLTIGLAALVADKPILTTNQKPDSASYVGCLKPNLSQETPENPTQTSTVHCGWLLLHGFVWELISLKSVGQSSCSRTGYPIKLPQIGGPTPHFQIHITNVFGCVHVSIMCLYIYIIY